MGPTQVPQENLPHKSTQINLIYTKVMYTTDRHQWAGVVISSSKVLAPRPLWHLSCAQCWDPTEQHG
jgi:hypothetical protein